MAATEAVYASVAPVQELSAVAQDAVVAAVAGAAAIVARAPEAVVALVAAVVSFEAPGVWFVRNPMAALVL